MEIAKNGIASGSVRDLPPSKRFRYVGSHLGSTPSVLLPAKKRVLPPPQPPEAATVALCLPVKKRAIAAPRVQVADAPFCLPAKKRAILAAPPPEDAAPACLPAKKRAYAAPADAAVPACVPAKKRPCGPPPPPPPGAVASAKKRVHAPAPRGDAAGSVPACLPPGRRACAAPPVDTVASACVSAKKRPHSPARREDAARSAPVCLPVNKRVMPPPPVQSDGARVVNAKEARPQGSSKHAGGGAINSRVASGTEERARGEEFKKPEKSINHKGIKEQVPMKLSKASSPRKGKGLEKQPCKIVDGEQSEVVVEVRKKSDEAAGAKITSVKKEPRNGSDEVAQEREGEPVEVEDDDGVLCAVCASTDGDPSDPIVFCDGCDLMVHASCYGNPLAQAIPDGDWFCSLCIAKKNKPAVRRRSCCLCPSSGGAMKRTTDGKWAHISCALLVPEVFFRDPDGRDGIDCSRVPAHRFAKACYICEGNKGCALECAQPKCGLGFHVSCGLGAGLCIEYQEGKGGAIVAGFCREHTELWEKVKTITTFTN